MYGRKLNENDQIMFNKSKLIVKIQRKLSAYENFHAIHMEDEALNALLEGVVVYDNDLRTAEEYQMTKEYDAVYEQLLEKLEETYGLDEQAARDIIALDSDLDYTLAIRNIVGMDTLGISSNAIAGLQQEAPGEQETSDENVTEENRTEGYEDLLPEETE